MEIEDEKHLVSDNILVWAPCYPAHEYGNEVGVEGKLETLPVFEGSSYRDYLARQEIQGMVGWRRISLLLRGEDSSPSALPRSPSERERRPRMPASWLSPRRHYWPASCWV